MAIKKHGYKHSKEYIKNNPGGNFHEQHITYPYITTDYYYVVRMNGYKEILDIKKDAADKLKRDGILFAIVSGDSCAIDDKDRIIYNRMQEFNLPWDTTNKISHDGFTKDDTIRMFQQLTAEVMTS